MKSFKILLAASVLALSASSAFAWDDQQQYGSGAGYGSWNDQSGTYNSSNGIGSQILNSQVNLQTNWSNLIGVVDTVGGDAVAQGAAAGNMVDITTMNDTRVLNNQIVGSNATIGSNISMDANKVWGSVGVQNQVLCNGASVSTDPILTSVRSNQECHAKDPYSEVQGYVTNVGGNAVFQGSALANTFEADSNAPNMPIFSRQLNTSGVISNMAVNAFNVGGTVGMSSSAIGNTSQIIHYNTNGH